ncbi:hypothetical protein HYH02_013763 [Chlamydomonas schloesseri]|nr:hypothetical protein HYH02_013763 [Chlamydomonas schloesseri]|eukprot:KAG2430403.1 hypothetical protein HYH02_013763 [Chlamydomonas schloesseri]
MALVEAAAAGLVVVSTAVGGVPEVLPPDMIVLTEPSAEGLLEGIECAIQRVPHQRPLEQHLRVRHMYDWNDVARRTSAVYDSVAASCRDDSLPARLARYLAAGRWVGALFSVVAVLSVLQLRLAEWWRPASAFDVAPDWCELHLHAAAASADVDTPGAGARGTRRAAGTMPTNVHGQNGAMMRR